MTIPILYVDDDPDIREIAEMALSLDPDLEVRTCSSGNDAIALVGQWLPRLILLDFMMPDLDGPATLRLLRQNSRLDHVPVVFITARTSAKDVESLLASGAAGVLAKPFDVMTLAGQCRAFVP
ncbi:MAG: response regulator [Novosphingobium sp.]|uniref:response regulator n=1 Tax=Novosphingobium sp. TaxID=1874826 RepID=UPI003B998737